MRMYQEEMRYSSQQAAQIAAARKDLSMMNNTRPVSVIDYNEFRKLEDKRDKILLKKTLYERKKVNDESQVKLLNNELDG